MRVLGLHRRLGREDLGPAERRVHVDHLPLQVGVLDHVVVDHPDRAHPGGAEVEQRRGAEAAGPDHQHPRVPEPLLSGPAEFAQHDVAGVALKLHVTEPARPRRGAGILCRRPSLCPAAELPEAGAVEQHDGNESEEHQPAGQRAAGHHTDRMAVRQDHLRQHREAEKHRKHRIPRSARHTEPRAAEPEDRREEKDRQHQPRPVEPKPPCPRTVSSSVSAST